METRSIIFQPSERISGIKPYYFSQLNQKITELKANGLDIIRLDMGSPDLPPDPSIIDKLVNVARRPDVHGYSPIGGTPVIRNAVVKYYQNRFEVDLDPKSEVLALIGSKEGLFNLSQVLLNPGDVSLVPDPGYPVYTSSAQIAGAEVYPVPLCEEHDYLPDLEAIPNDILDRAKILWLNYPNNPTGAVATMEFFEEVVEFAREHHILIAHDAPYVDVCFDHYRAPSLLQVSGAKEVAVEFNSLSKSYNMGGWRVGMAVGNPQVISLLNTYKSQMDTSSFDPILEAGALALTGDQEWLVGRNKIYQERRDIIVDGLRKGGLVTNLPLATIYVWARIPAGKSSMNYCNSLLEETGVSTTPGVVYGATGEGYLRVSLGLATERIREAMDRFIQWAR